MLNCINLYFKSVSRKYKLLQHLQLCTKSTMFMCTSYNFLFTSGAWILFKMFGKIKSYSV